MIQWFITDIAVKFNLADTKESDMNCQCQWSVKDTQCLFQLNEIGQNAVHTSFYRFISLQTHLK